MCAITSQLNPYLRHLIKKEAIISSRSFGSPARSIPSRILRVSRCQTRAGAAAPVARGCAAPGRTAVPFGAGTWRGRGLLPGQRVTAGGSQAPRQLLPRAGRLCSWHAAAPGCCAERSGHGLLHGRALQGLEYSRQSTRVKDAPQKQQPLTAALALSPPWETASGRSPAGDTTGFGAPFGQKSRCDGAIGDGAPKGKILRDVYGNPGIPAVLPPCWLPEPRSALLSPALGSHQTGTG